jgi:hypothetical protein
MEARGERSFAASEGGRILDLAWRAVASLQCKVGEGREETVIVGIGIGWELDSKTELASKIAPHRFYRKNAKLEKPVGFWYKIQFLKFVKRRLKPNGFLKNRTIF